MIHVHDSFTKLNASCLHPSERTTHNTKTDTAAWGESMLMVMTIISVIVQVG